MTGCGRNADFQQAGGPYEHTAQARSPRRLGKCNTFLGWPDRPVLTSAPGVGFGDVAVVPGLCCPAGGGPAAGRARARGSRGGRGRRGDLRRLRRRGPQRLGEAAAADGARGRGRLPRSARRRLGRGEPGGAQRLRRARVRRPGAERPRRRAGHRPRRGGDRQRLGLPLPPRARHLARAPLRPPRTARARGGRRAALERGRPPLGPDPPLRRRGGAPLARRRAQGQRRPGRARHRAPDRPARHRGGAPRRPRLPYQLRPGRGALGDRPSRRRARPGRGAHPRRRQHPARPAPPPGTCPRTAASSGW